MPFLPRSCLRVQRYWLFWKYAIPRNDDFVFSEKSYQAKTDHQNATFVMRSNNRLVFIFFWKRIDCILRANRSGRRSGSKGAWWPWREPRRRGRWLWPPMMQTGRQRLRRVRNQSSRTIHPSTNIAWIAQSIWRNLSSRLAVAGFHSEFISYALPCKFLQRTEGTHMRSIIWFLAKKRINECRDQHDDRHYQRQSSVRLLWSDHSIW